MKNQTKIAETKPTVGSARFCTSDWPVAPPEAPEDSKTFVAPISDLTLASLVEKWYNDHACHEPFFQCALLSMFYWCMVLPRDHCHATPVAEGHSCPTCTMFELYWPERQLQDARVQVTGHISKVCPVALFEAYVKG